MHSSSLFHRSARWATATRIVLFASLALAAAVPSHAARGGKNVGSPPTISGTPPANVTVGQAYSFRPSASDPDGDGLSFRVRNLPPWARFDGATGTLNGAPTSASVGTYSNIEIRVTDGRNWVALPTFSIVVAALQQTIPDTPNSAPTISGAPGTGAASGQLYGFRPTAADADGDPLTFSIQGKPSWASFDGANGSLYGTPAATDVGTASGIVISVSDGEASTSLPAFAITVAQTNRAPAISGSPATNATVGQAYTFRPTASDADGDNLTFSVRGNPAWLSINSTDGTLAGIPAAANVGTVSGIVISVSDGTAYDQPARIRHHGRADQPCTDDFRLARHQRTRRPAVCVPPDSDGRGR